MLLCTLLLPLLAAVAALGSDTVAVEFDIRFSPPTVVGHSNTGENSSARVCKTSGGPTPQHPSIPWGLVSCHYWFPSYLAQLGVGPGSVLLQSIKHCGDPAGPMPAKNSLAMSSDGGRTYEPVAVHGAIGDLPFPIIPESSVYKDRTLTPSNFTVLSEISCVNASCSGSMARWHASFTRRPFMLSRGHAMPLAITGVPSTMSRAWIVMHVIRLRKDSSLLAVANGHASDAPHVCSSCPNPTCRADGRQNRGPCNVLYFFACPDPVNAPHAWVYRSRVDYVAEMTQLNNGFTVGGPMEPDIAQLADGRLLTVFRVDSYTTHWAAVSDDGLGLRWSKPFPTHTWAVLPSKHYRLGTWS